MPESGAELHGIAWTRALPYTRLFRTFAMAIWPSKVALCLAGVLVTYVAARALDVIWVRAGSGVIVSRSADGEISEMEAFDSLSGVSYTDWRRSVVADHRAYAAESVAEACGVGVSEAETRLATRTARQIVEQSHPNDRVACEKLIGERLAGGLAAVDQSTATSAERRERRWKLKRAADCLRLILSAYDPHESFTPDEIDGAAALLVDSDPGVTEADRAAQREQLSAAMGRHLRIIELEKRRPRGPLMGLLNYELRCFSAAAAGIAAGRLVLSGAASDVEPSLLGSLGSAFRGGLWLATQRPCLFVVFGLVSVAVFAFAGGATCRMAALEATRNERETIAGTIRFARGKLDAFVLSALLPAAILIGLALLLALAGAATIIPFIGVVLAGLFYVVALLLGLGLALFLIATLLGFSFMWPTIATEGSDYTDALSRSLGYVGQRLWHTGFGSIVLWVYGGACLLVVRFIALVTLKCTHMATGWGMNLLGTRMSSRTSTFGKLDAMWHMPGWSDLSFIPTASATPFWGAFGQVPLSASEQLAAWLIAVWVFLLVGAVFAFGLSFYFCGSTQLYLLLRREIDGTDFEEVFSESFEGALPAAETPNTSAGTAAESRGTPLPVFPTRPG
ncbi:MAG: hypothetical protein CHACPFDD_02460 [Phycisphaerae bacterium]|nr:hypothetical protein [Phycisphaerae bacterium]